jgi:hypothetical protein
MPGRAAEAGGGATGRIVAVVVGFVGGSGGPAFVTCVRIESRSSVNRVT